MQLAAAPVPKPVPLGVYSHCQTSRKYGTVCDPTLQIAKDGRRVSALTAYPKCSLAPLKKAPSAKIAHGRFRYRKKLRNRLGTTVSVRLAGHVLARKRIRVSYRLTTKACGDRTHTVTLTFRKVGKPGEVG